MLLNDTENNNKLTAICEMFVFYFGIIRNPDS